MNDIGKALIEYSNRTKDIFNWWHKEDYIYKISSEFTENYISKNIYFIQRKKKTDLSVFEKEFGYKLPSDIADYINLFWHPSIKGFYKIDECIILFPVIKYDNENENDVIFHKNCVINLAREWVKIKNGDVNKYLPIGWTLYTGSSVLYDLNSKNIYIEDLDIEGKPSDKPIADSLVDLINNLRVN